jgi:hypothetical protein
VPDWHILASVVISLLVSAAFVCWLARGAVNRFAACVLLGYGMLCLVISLFVLLRWLLLMTGAAAPTALWDDVFEEAGKVGSEQH